MNYHFILPIKQLLERDQSCLLWGTSPFLEQLVGGMKGWSRKIVDRDGGILG
jgi:hypothetical protein